MRKEIECFLNRNYYQLLNISNKITKNNQLSQDLLHEVILQLYDKDDIVLKSYDDNSIKYYITAIMRINYYSKTSPFYYKIKRERVLMISDLLPQPKTCPVSFPVPKGSKQKIKLFMWSLIT